MNSPTITLPSEVVLEADNEEGGSYLGTINILGYHHHFQAIRVTEGEDVKGYPFQHAFDGQWQETYDHLQWIYDGIYQTVKLPGVEGDFILILHPFER